MRIISLHTDHIKTLKYTYEISVAKPDRTTLHALLNKEQFNFFVDLVVIKSFGRFSYEFSLDIFDYLLTYFSSPLEHDANANMLICKVLHKIVSWNNLLSKWWVWYSVALI